MKILKEIKDKEYPKDMSSLKIREVEDELLDVVDEKNVLTGKNALRSKIHSEGIWHRVVHIYLFRKNENGIEFLVHLRSLNKDLSPNCWDTRFGGHIKSGSTVEEGVRVELKEEVGLDTKDYNVIEGTWYKRDGFPNREFTKVYYLEYRNNLSELVFSDGEVQEVKWMGSKDIKIAIEKNPEKWAANLDGFIDVLDYLMRKIQL